MALNFFRIFIALAISKESFSQQHKTNNDSCIFYKYEVAKKFYLSNDSLDYRCMEAEFFLKREYTMNQIKETAFFVKNRDTAFQKTDLFKVVNKTWYIYKKNKWVYFFSVNNFKKNILSPGFGFIDDKKYKLSPLKTENVGKDTLYYFKVRLVSTIQSDASIYLFSPIKGFVGIEYPNCDLALRKLY